MSITLSRLTSLSSLSGYIILYLRIIIIVIITVILPYKRIIISNISERDLECEGVFNLNAIIIIACIHS